MLLQFNYQIRGISIINYVSFLMETTIASKTACESCIRSEGVLRNEYL